MEKLTAEQVLYALGELLMTECDIVEDVRYTRGEEGCLYAVLTDGRRLRLSVREA